MYFFIIFWYIGLGRCGCSNDQLHDKEKFLYFEVAVSGVLVVRRAATLAAVTAVVSRLLAVVYEVAEIKK